MSDPGGTMREGEIDLLPLSMPPALRSPLSVQDRASRETINTATKEACAAWERSLRPGQYYSEHGGRRPMRHRTQAVQGHPGARSWPRGPDGGAWGPQELSPIPSEGSFMPLVPSPTASPGRRSPVRGAKSFFPGQRSSASGKEETVGDDAALADVAAAEIGIEGFGRDVLKPFEPIPLADEVLPPPPPAAPLEAPWRAPPPGFDVRTLRRQASTLRGEAAAACRDEEQVRLSSLQLAETLSATVRNGRDNAAAARERLCGLHAALRRLRVERRSHGEAIRAAVSWQDSLEELREKLASTEERRRRAEWAEGDARRALEATVDANRVAEEEVVPLEHALEAARRRDDVAVAIELRTQQEDLADAFRVRRCRGGDSDPALDASTLVARNAPTRLTTGGAIDREESAPDGSRFASPLLVATMSWGFQAFAEACRRSKGMRRLAAIRDVREEEERRGLLREVLTVWAIGAALERRERGARRRRAEEAARLCLARWRLFAALERRFRVERRRRTCLRVVGAWRDLVKEGRRRRDLDQRRQALVLRRCFRGWRILRAKSTLTSQEYSERCGIADRHRLMGLFATWHFASLASAASSAAAVRGFQSRRGVATLAGNFRAWASLSRARRWRRLCRLRRGLEGLASFAELSAGSWPRRFYTAGAGTQDASNKQRGFLPWEAEGTFREGGRGWPEDWAPTAAGLKRQRQQQYGGHGANGSDLSRLSSAVSSASAHRRRVVLTKGLRALRFGTAQRRSDLFIFDPQSSGVLFSGVSAQTARSALSAWRAFAAKQRRSRARCALAEEKHRRRCLVESLRAWGRLVAVEARQRRADRVHMLKRTFVALRQACASSRRQRAACRALCNVFRSRRESLLGSAMQRLSAGPSTAAAAAAARAKAGAARRRRERESLGAAWRWWVSGWLRRQAQGTRMRELEERRRRNRDRDLQEELMQVEEASAALSKEALTVETALESTKLLALEQEEALAVSRKSLAEASVASAAMKTDLGQSTRVKVKGRKRTLAPATDTGVSGRGKGGGGGGSGRSTKVVEDEQDRRLRARRLACQRAAASALAGVEARRKAAEDSVAARERSTATIRAKLRGQEQSDQVKLQETLDEVRRYRDAVDAGQARLEAAEAERLRVRAESARLLERVNTLARTAGEEATKGARGASSAESERAALSLEVSTAEARTKEIMLILDEREKEAAELRRALAAKETARQEKRLDSTAVATATWTGTPDVPAEKTFSNARKELPGLDLEGAANQETRDGRHSPPSVDPPPDDFDVQGLKESIALLRAKVESSTFASGS